MSRSTRVEALSALCLIGSAQGAANQAHDEARARRWAKQKAEEEWERDAECRFQQDADVEAQQNWKREFERQQTEELLESVFPQTLDKVLGGVVESFIEFVQAQKEEGLRGIASQVIQKAYRIHISKQKLARLRQESEHKARQAAVQRSGFAEHQVKVIFGVCGTTEQELADYKRLVATTPTLS